jgi:hypothetical protein
MRFDVGHRGLQQADFTRHWLVQRRAAVRAAAKSQWELVTSSAVVST